MKRKDIVVNIILALSLTAFGGGCATKPTKPLTLHQRYEAACVGGGTSFEVITAVNDLKPLTASQQKQAADAYGKLKPRCKLAPGQDYPYTVSEIVLDELENSAAVLKQIEGAVK